MYAIDPVQKANRRYMVTSAEILPRTQAITLTKRIASEMEIPAKRIAN